MSKSLLIAEDSEHQRKMLVRLLSEEYDIIEVANGAEVIAALEKTENSISTVLLDIVMPVMDGLEVLRRMQANPAWSQIPVIVITANTDEKLQEETLSLGAVGFAAKPFNEKILKYTLRNSINLREMVSIADSVRRDTLTGLYNREAFFEEAERKIKKHDAGFYILSCFDIDNFKVINDQYGTETGDLVLKYVAKCLNECALKLSGICCRFMADKFAILYHAKYRNSEFLSLLHDKVMSPDCIEHKIKLRIGQYVVDDCLLPISSMFDRATMAEESIKGKYGQLIAVYDESMRENLLREQKIVNAMSGALQSNQFEPWFQPQYNHSTGALIGAEALVRWRTPQGKLIPPGVFIPVFERNGFVYEVDKFIWEQTCLNLRYWIDNKMNCVPVSVNISRYDLFAADFIEVLTGLVKKYNIPIDMLRLEITESAFAKSTEHIVSVVKQLIDFGFTVEIDDFGSGYSSLNTLKDVPATILKLDMKFLENTSSADRSGSIIESVVRMAKWLGMSVIAEGVETKNQADYLNSIGCYYIQGYYYAKPMPYEDYVKRLSSAVVDSKLNNLETVATFDSYSFWDPNSIESLIFNSYVGGANVIEYHNGKIEGIRRNERYKLEFCNKKFHGKNVCDINPLDILDEKNIDKYYENIHNAISTGKESTCDLSISGFDDSPEDDVLYLRWTARVIARTQDRYLLYCTIFNITQIRTAEYSERKATEQLKAILDNVSCGISAVALNDNSYDVIFINDKFFDIFDCTREQYNGKINSIYPLIIPEDREKVERDIEQAAMHKRNIRTEFRIRRSDGSVRWIEDMVVIGNFVGIDVPVKLAIYTDITSEREADSQLQLFNNIATKLLSQSDIEAGINDTLEMVMNFFDGQRAYIFEFDAEKNTASNTYEICADNITAEKMHLQNIPISSIPFWLDEFESKNFVAIDNVDDIDDSRADEKKILTSQGITSLVAVPLRCEGRLFGFVGINDIGSKHIHADKLSALGDYISVLIARRDLHAKIDDESQAIMSIVDGMPGGFVRMKLNASGQIVPLYYSDGFLKMLGYTRENVPDITVKSAADRTVAGVHPDDMILLSNAIDSLEQNGISHSAKIRVAKCDGRYIWVLFFGKIRQSITGENFVNVYFTDVSDVMTLDDQQKELLDNLPYGTGIYEISHGKFKSIYINKHSQYYFEHIIGKDKADPVFDVYHHDDLENAKNVVNDMLTSGRNFESKVRMRSLNGGYEPYKIIGRVISRTDDTCRFFVTFIPSSLL